METLYYQKDGNKGETSHQEDLDNIELKLQKLQKLQSLRNEQHNRTLEPKLCERKFIVDENFDRKTTGRNLAFNAVVTRSEENDRRILKFDRKIDDNMLEET